MRPRAMKAHCTSIHWLSDSITAGCGMPLLGPESWFVGRVRGHKLHKVLHLHHAQQQ